jgi:hypothetical protein
MDGEIATVQTLTESTANRLITRLRHIRCIRLFGDLWDCTEWHLHRTRPEVID